VPPRPRSAFGLAAAGVTLLAGCGGQARGPEPRLAHGDAAQLIRLARQVERDAPANGCAARREIAALSAQAHALVTAGRVPLRLRAPLLAGVAAVGADAPACSPPAPAPNPAPAPVAAAPPPGKAHEHARHDHGPDHGQGHGHGHGRHDG
jgi:hypothetical protein